MRQTFDRWRWSSRIETAKTYRHIGWIYHKQMAVHIDRTGFISELKKFEDEIPYKSCQINKHIVYCLFKKIPGTSASFKAKKKVELRYNSQNPRVYNT